MMIATLAFIAIVVGFILLAAWLGGSTGETKGKAAGWGQYGGPHGGS